MTEDNLSDDELQFLYARQNDGPIRAALAELARWRSEAKVDHWHCSNGCEKALFELRCVKCGAPRAPCTPENCP